MATNLDHLDDDIARRFTASELVEFLGIEMYDLLECIRPYVNRFRRELCAEMDITEVEEDEDGY